jgi:hypothetical protein
MLVKAMKIQWLHTVENIKNFNENNSFIEKFGICEHNDGLLKPYFHVK